MLHLRAFSQREGIFNIDAEVADVLSIFVWPSRICTARRFPVCL
jgi:hypothetical protein